MQVYTLGQSGPPPLPDIRPVIASYLEDPEMTESELEDRLVIAFREYFCSRHDMEKLKADLLAEIHSLLERVKEGNGTPGLNQLNLRLDRIEQKAKPRERVRMHVVTASITVIVGLAITWGVGAARAKMFVEPVAKEVNAVKAVTTTEVDELKQKIDTLIQQQQTQPTVVLTRGRGKGRTAPVPAMPKGKSQALPDGAMITTRDHLPPVIGWNRIPIPEMKVPE